jgi:Spy/CpxP family protein refolding chaperone
MTRVLGLLGVVVGAMALVVPGAVAATSPGAVADVLESQVAVNRTEMMTRAVLLPRGESDAFWPLYREYERERNQLEGRARALLEDYLTSAQTIDDAAAQALLDQLFDLYEQRLTALRKYATALRAKLPARQAAGFVQTVFELLRLLDLQRDARLEFMR